MTVAIQEVHKRLSVLQTTIDSLRETNKVTLEERNTLQTNLLKATDDLQNALNEKLRLEKLGAQLAAQIVKLKELISVTHVTWNDLLKYAPTGLEGEVTAVPRPDVVEISVGADDGVRKGHKFVVTRRSAGGKFIGMIEVIQVDFGNRAVCRPDKATLSDQIQRGDHVKAYTKPG